MRVGMIKLLCRTRPLISCCCCPLLQMNKLTTACMYSRCNSLICFPLAEVALSVWGLAHLLLYFLDTLPFSFWRVGGGWMCLCVCAHTHKHTHRHTYINTHAHTHFEENTMKTGALVFHIIITSVMVRLSRLHMRVFYNHLTMSVFQQQTFRVTVTTKNNDQTKSVRTAWLFAKWRRHLVTQKERLKKFNCWIFEILRWRWTLQNKIMCWHTLYDWPSVSCKTDYLIMER